MQKQKFVAIDRQILHGLSAGAPDHVEALTFLRRIGFAPIVTPVVRASIRRLTESPEEEIHRRAHLIEVELWDSDIYTHPTPNDTYADVLDRHATELVGKDLIEGLTKADALVLIEASYFDAEVLLTRIPALKNASTNHIKVGLVECGLSSIAVLSPKQISDYIKFVEAKRTEEPSLTNL